MFKDYYAILNIDINASEKEIKMAFKREAIKWHPDKNAGKDTTVQMQNINEAYLILRDAEARLRYDLEYSKFRLRQTHKNKSTTADKTNNYESKEPKPDNSYTVEDELLKKWMENAKRQAVDLAKATLDDLVGMVAVGTKVALKETVNYTVFYVIISVAIFILILIFRSCNN